MSLQPYYNIENKYEIGIDEAGRGPLFGRLYVAAVILPKDGSFYNKNIKDSKKIKSIKMMESCYQYITQNALYYAIHYIEHTTIDDINIRQSVFKGMHDCIREITQKIPDIQNDSLFLLVDGNDFKPYVTFNENTKSLYTIPHETIEQGDNQYMSIAAASILAKYSRDKYIKELCEEYPELTEKYGMNTNMGYGTKRHLDGIKQYGITQWHRKTYGICRSSEFTPLFKSKIL